MAKAPRRGEFAERLRVARRHIRGIPHRHPTSGEIFQERAHFTPESPRRDDCDTGDISQAESVLRSFPGFDGNIRGDADLGEIGRRNRRAQIRIGDINQRRGFKRRADALLPALDLQRAGDHGSDATDFLPFRRQRIVAPFRWNLRKGFEMHRQSIGIARQPRLLAGESEDRRKP